MRNSTITKAKAILNQRKHNAVMRSSQLQSQLMDMPQWAQLERAIRQADLDICLARINGSDTTILHNQRDLLYSTRKYLLGKMKLTEDMLQPQYSCTMCSDTGYIDGIMCSCMKDIIHSIVLGAGDIAIPTASFEGNTDNNQHNCKVYTTCQKLCSKIDSTVFRNLLLTGKTGTGKTHLLSCMANQLTLQGKDIVMITATALNQQLLHLHLSSTAERAEYLDNINDIDILMIDDLGAENKYNNVTTEYLFGIVNERMLGGKHTFISTNLSLAQIQERYGDRIFSRLADQSCTLTAQLIDKDKRLK